MPNRNSEVCPPFKNFKIQFHKGLFALCSGLENKHLRAKDDIFKSANVRNPFSKQNFLIEHVLFQI